MNSIKTLCAKPDLPQEIRRLCPPCKQPNAHCPIASFPLSLAEEGETVRIIMIRSGHRLIERLLSMGLQVEDAVTVVCKQPGGATIIEKSGNRYALGGGMSLKINVIRC